MKTPLRQTLILLLLSTLFVMFFVGGPDYYSARSFKVAWNIGHYVFFALATFLVVSHWQDRLQQRFYLTLCLTVVASLAIGAGIEYFQGNFATNRSMDFNDLWRNTTGALMGLLFLTSLRHTLPITLSLCAQSLLVAVFLYDQLPLYKALDDEINANRSFPLLADFETQGELARWVKGQRNTEWAFHGNASLQVDLSTATFSGTGLKYFPGNWEDYQVLRFSVFNPDEEPITLNYRIHDREHQRGTQAFEDRFNQSDEIAQGWNEVSISLQDVMNAPQHRLMNLREIAGVGIFASRLKKPRRVFIDYLRLE